MTLLERPVKDVCALQQSALKLSADSCLFTVLEIQASELKCLCFFFPPAEAGD